MKAIGITQRDSDFTVAIIKAHDELDDEFARTVRAMHGWEKSSDEDLLAAQTFVAWLQNTQSYYRDQSIAGCLEACDHCWSEIMEVEETPYRRP